MPRYEKESKIKILRKEYSVEDLLHTLTNYPSEFVEAFFRELNMSFPRELRIDVLREVLRPYVLTTRIKRTSLADEMNYRLSWFNQFTEVQLINLFKFYKDNELEKEYLEQLWLAIIENITDRSISEKDFHKLIDLSREYSSKNGLKQPDIIKYNEKLNSLFYDEKGSIDGLKQNIIRPVLYKSSTITEIRELGLKYNVNVPNRLKKAELIDIIVAELKERGTYTEEQEVKLHSMSIIVIQRFAKNNNIKASTELKKEEVIEYILSNASETRDTYFIPSNSVYEVEAHDIGEAMPEIPREEPEEVIEEEPVVEEAPVQTVVTQGFDEQLMRDLIDSIKSQPAVSGGVMIQEKEYEFVQVEETYLNTTEIKGSKYKPVIKELNNNYVIEATEGTEKCHCGPYQPEPVSKKPLTVGRVLLNILYYTIVIVLLILIVAVVYVALTPTVPAGMVKFENFIDGIFNLNALSWLRETFHKFISVK